MSIGTSAVLPAKRPAGFCLGCLGGGGSPFSNAESVCCNHLRLGRGCHLLSHDDNMAELSQQGDDNLTKFLQGSCFRIDTRTLSSLGDVKTNCCKDVLQTSSEGTDTRAGLFGYSCLDLGQYEIAEDLNVWPMSAAVLRYHHESPL